MYEYLVKRCRIAKVDPYHYDGRHYFIGKGVKDYLLLTGKEEFTFDEIAEMIDSNAVVNYSSDMLQQIMLLVWSQLSGQNVLIEKQAGSNVNSESLSTMKLHDYHVHFAHFQQTGRLDLYNDRVLEFDNWSVSIPFITNQTVLDPIEATLDFFKTPVELRGKPYPLTGDHREPGRPFAAQFLRSYLERSEVLERRFLSNLDINRRVGLYVSVQEMPDVDEPFPALIELGHQHYGYKNETRQIYWVELQEEWETAWRNRHSAGTGLPYCIFENMNRFGLQEWFKTRCPPLSKDDTSLRGMSRQFLSDLGVNDERIINGNATLSFLVAFIF